MRYYYKNGNSYFNLKSPVNDPAYEEITEEQFYAATQPPQPTEEQIALQNKVKLIAEKKKLLNKYREDVEQVDLFGMEREDYAAKKELCKQLVLELRVLEK